jgi:hypothetical protein
MLSDAVMRSVRRVNLTITRTKQSTNNHCSTLFDRSDYSVIPADVFNTGPKELPHMGHQAIANGK